MLLAAGMRMPIGEHQAPAVPHRFGGQFLDDSGVPDVEGKVVEARAAALARARSGTQISTR